MAPSMEEGRRRTSRWSIIFALVLAAVLLVLAFRGVAWNDMLATVQQAHFGYLALAFCVMSASYFVRGLRWRVLLSAERAIAPLTVFWATIVGYLGNSFLPARAGELIRTVMIGRKANISKSYVLATAITERLMDVVALVLISLVALLSLSGIPEWLLTASKVMSVVAVIGVVCLFLVSRLETIFKRMIRLLPASQSIHERLDAILEQFLLGTRAFQNPGRALSFTALTALIWFMDAVLMIEISQALNLTLNFSQAFVLLAALGLAWAAPSRPGFVGIYQYVAVTVLVPFGFSRSDALVYIICFQAVGYAVVIVWGLLGIWRLNITQSISGTPQSMQTYPHDVGST